MDTKGMQKFMVSMSVVMLISLVIVSLWNHIPIIKNTAHAILNPTAGALMNWHLTFGALILFFIIAIITTFVQKYFTDQETLKAIKKEQKDIQNEMQKYKDNPSKVLELNKQSMKLMGEMMTLGMKSSFITIIPLILLFRWFMDYFAQIPDFRFFGFFSWFWFYLLSVIIFSSILRKVLKVN